MNFFSTVVQNDSLKYQKRFDSDDSSFRPGVLGDLSHHFHGHGSRKYRFAVQYMVLQVQIVSWIQRSRDFHRAAVYPLELDIVKEWKSDRSPPPRSVSYYNFDLPFLAESEFFF